MEALLTVKDLSLIHNLHPNTVKYRLRKGIPLDKPLRGKPGGNYSIERPMAVKIWRELQKLEPLEHKAIAEKLGVKLSVVQQISSGKTWNDVTGKPKKPRVY